MKQDFTFSQSVLLGLKYTDREIKQIIGTLQESKFAYVGKKEHPVILANDTWLKDILSKIH